MARTQNPDVRRSGAPNSGENGPVPEDNVPGHHPEHDQDRPDLDAFAARFSGRDLDDLPADTGVVDASYRATADDGPSVGQTLKRVAPAIGVTVLVAGLTIWLRRRRRTPSLGTVLHQSPSSWPSSLSALRNARRKRRA